MFSSQRRVIVRRVVIAVQPNADAKLTPALIDAALYGFGDQHAVQPLVLSITQSTECASVL